MEKSSERLALLSKVKAALQLCGIQSEEYKDWTDEQVVNKLLQLLQESMPEPDMGDAFPILAKALGECRASQAVGLLIKGLDSSRKYRVADAAKALGKIGDKSVIEKLKPLLHHKERLVQVAAAESLARLGQSEGLKALREIMEEREPWAKESDLVTSPSYLEVECARILYQFGDSSGVKLLIEYLDHPDYWGVFNALQALMEVKAPECADAVKKHLPKYSLPLHILPCVSILAESGDYSGLPHLLEILTISAKEDRLKAANICGWLGLRELLEPLHSRLSAEGDEEVRLAIKRAIERIEESPTVAVSKVPELAVLKAPPELIIQLGEELLRNPGDLGILKKKAEVEIHYFTGQLEKGDDRQEALNRLGFAHLFKGGTDHIMEAGKSFQKALAEKPDDHVALFGLARMSLSLGSPWEKGPSETLKALLKAEEIATKPLVDLYGWPGNDLYLWLGRCYFEMSDFPKAIEHLEKAIRLNNDVIMGHTLLGRALLADSQLDSAIQALQQAIKLHPQDDDPHLYLAAIYQVLGQHQQAQQHLEQADRIRVYPRRLTSQAQVEIQAQVMRAQSKQRLSPKKKWWKPW